MHENRVIGFMPTTCLSSRDVAACGGTEGDEPVPSACRPLVRLATHVPRRNLPRRARRAHCTLALSVAVPGSVNGHVFVLFPPLVVTVSVAVCPGGGAGVTVSVAVLVAPPYEPVIVTGVDAPTAAVAIANVALVLPAAI